MSFRGHGGRGRGGQGFGGRGRGNFGGNRGKNFYQGPPDQIIPLGYVDYNVQDDLVCKVELEDVPYFNAPIYLENKEEIGKIDEIFGNIKDYSVTIRLGEEMKANSFKKSQKLFIDPAKLLPLQRFLPKPPGTIQKKSAGRGGGNRGGRGNFGGRGRVGFGGRGGNRNSFGGRTGDRGRGGYGGGRGRGGGFNQSGGGFNKSGGGFNKSGGGFNRNSERW